MFYDFSRTLFTLAILILSGLTVFTVGEYSYSPIFLAPFIISQVFTKNYATVGSLAYLILGLLGLQIFSFGAGLSYVLETGFIYLLALVPFTIFAFLYRSSFEETLDDKKKLYKPLLAFLVLHIFANALLILTMRFNVFKFIDLSLWTLILDLLLAYLAINLIHYLRLKVKN